MEQEQRQESRIDEFLDLYKQVEDVLEDKYRNAEATIPVWCLNLSRM